MLTATVCLFRSKLRGCQVRFEFELYFKLIYLGNSPTVCCRIDCWLTLLNCGSQSLYHVIYILSMFTFSKINIDSLNFTLCTISKQ